MEKCGERLVAVIRVTVGQNNNPNQAGGLKLTLYFLDRTRQ